MRLAGEYWRVRIHLVRDWIGGDVEVDSVIVGTFSTSIGGPALHHPRAGEEFYLVPATLWELVMAEEPSP